MSQNAADILNMTAKTAINIRVSEDDERKENFEDIEPRTCLYIKSKLA